MARIIPPDFNAPNQTGLHESERQTLEYLAEALPDSYTVFSNVMWARSHAHNTRFGEIDFAVVSPAGQLIVIEQKSGGMSVRDGHLYKRYGVTEKDAGQQLLRTISALKDVWQKQHLGESVAIDYLLFLPDYSLKQINGLQLDASRIVHATSAESLAQTIETLCGDHPADDDKVAAMHDFLSGVLELELDIGRLQSHQERLYRRHEESLLAWVNRLHFTPYVLRINGCAGSGKTQIAAGMFREARQRGEEARYICFNRPLADGLGKALRDPERIHSRDQFYDRFLKSQDAIFDYDDNEGSIFARIEEMVARTPVPEDWLTDLLIIDEGQDIPARSMNILKRFLRPGGRLVWLEDPEQNLYQHEQVSLPEAVELRLDQCFRSPQAILKYLTTLVPVKRTLIPANPHVGEVPEFHVATAAQLPALLTSRLEALTAKGIPPEDIAIVSMRSIKKSALYGLDSLGGFRLSSFTGQYSPEGEQLWSEGEILLDSIYRFKGSQKPFVFLVDVDAEAMTDDVVRRIYCGMTRATLGVELFMTPQFETVLRNSLA